MGGSGSTRWAGHEKAATVEDSYVLDAADLTRKSLLPKEPAFRFLNLTWSSVPSGRELASIGFVVDTRDEPFARLHYQVNGNPQDYRVRLESTRPPFGGLRWWWRCPALGCGKRVQKLYLPPSARFFGCRSCHRLTYRSSQEHDKGVDAFLRDPAATRSALTASPEDLSSGTILKALKAARVSRERTEKMLRRLER